MQVTEVKFNRRYKVAEYEHEDYTLTAILEKGDKPVAAMASLKADVALAFGGMAEESAPEPVEEKPAKEKKAKKAPEPEEEEIDPEAEEMGEDSEEEEIEEEVEEEKPAKAKKASKKKAQTYSRSSEQHKEILSTVLKAVAPDWKKTEEGKANAKKTSMEMEGEEFLDENGEVLESFKSQVKKMMSKKK